MGNAKTRDKRSKKDVLDVAQRLFHERGFQATSVRDIAGAMGIQAGSLYSHIESKDDLLWEIASSASDRFFEMIEPLAASDHLVPQKLRDVIRGHVHVMTEDLAAAAVYSTEWRHLSDDRKKQFIERRDRYESIIRNLVSQGIEQGHFGPFDPSAATLVILSTLNWIYQWFRPDGRMTPDDLAKMMTDFIFDGLKRRTV